MSSSIEHSLGNGLGLAGLIIGIVALVVAIFH